MKTLTRVILHLIANNKSDLLREKHFVLHFLVIKKERERERKRQLFLAIFTWRAHSVNRYNHCYTIDN